ncbi:arylsulfatase [Pontiella sulfatireligans]|uniref:Arylsulfatase n=1 Tax=Pontiella sulfatireligans TaxID=2750658 RepID=A0A6C2UI56_9BACT|nr:arylsulfatase [Pontiella sulfatireligans]SPS74290.1 sulfatase S1_17 [Kiritimatiellales bacterium]VGO19101.1 Arylsulfatase [Pontiella sulfatireligans]
MYSIFMKISVVLIGLVCWGSTAASAASGQKPNVILILTDDQGYGDLSAHGNHVLETPQMDKLHGKSIRLTDFHVAPVCTPTRGQLLTGQDALSNGASSFGYSRELMHRDIPTLANVFSANGYRTGLFGKWHLGDSYPHRPHDRGFQESICHGGASISQTTDYWNNDYFDDYFSHNGVMKQYKGYCTDVFFNESMKFMRQSKARKKPFFLFLPTNAPHGPLLVPQRYRQYYLDKGLNNATASFYGMIANIDENIGRLDQFLVDENLLENTILIFATDNGGTKGRGIYNAGMRGGKGKPYEGGHRVPFFISWPDGHLGMPRDIDELTQIQDVFPTLISLCNLQNTEALQLDGVDLSELLTGKKLKLEDRMLVVRWARQLDAPMWDGCVLWNKWRLVKGHELYDVAADPGQEKDIAAQHPEIMEQMLNHYEKWWTDIQPEFQTEECFVIGSDHENPLTLTCFDWFNHKGATKESNVTVQYSIRNGMNTNGVWKVDVAQDGDYEIELRRWPKEADAEISASIPVFEPVDLIPNYYGEPPYPVGKAFPIAQARLQIAGFDEMKNVSSSDKSIVFNVSLKKGRVEIKTSFLDKNGDELCGAYYAYVKRI